MSESGRTPAADLPPRRNLGRLFVAAANMLLSSIVAFFPMLPIFAIGARLTEGNPLAPLVFTICAHGLWLAITIRLYRWLQR